MSELTKRLENRAQKLEEIWKETRQQLEEMLNKMTDDEEKEVISGLSLEFIFNNSFQKIIDEFNFEELTPPSDSSQKDTTKREKPKLQLLKS